jgi:exonuclease SbcD
MKFLFFTDTHIKGAAPENRTDNFVETLKSKFLEIGKILKKYKIDYLLHGGDWFDKPDISPSIVSEFAIILKNFGKPIYSIAGNHDVYGQNIETLGRTMLGLLESVGVLKLINTGETVHLEEDSIKVQLNGSPYRYDIDGENYRNFYIVKKQKDVKYAINMVHGMLLDKPFIEGIKYTLIDDIKDTGADITLAGHYHSGFGIVQKASKYFANPGSLVRVTNTLSEISRKPKVIIIDVGESLSVREIELESAAPGEEVLDRNRLEYINERYTNLKLFYEEVQTSCNYRRVDLDSIINEIVYQNDLSSQVKDEAVRRIASAREGLSLEGEDF